jgi:hypothetical protein
VTWQAVSTANPGPTGGTTEGTPFTTVETYAPASNPAIGIGGASATAINIGNSGSTTIVAGALSATGAVALTGSGTALTVANNATIGGTLGVSGATTAKSLATVSGGSGMSLWTGQNFTWDGGNGNLVWQANEGGLYVHGSGSLYMDGTVQAASLSNPGNTQTLSGSQSPTAVISGYGNLAGSTTSSAGLSFATINLNSDQLAVPNGSISALNVFDYLGANATGSHLGISSQIAATAASTQVSSGNYVAVAGTINMNYGAGGTSSNFLGNQWAAVFQSQITAAAVQNWQSAIGVEVDYGAISGSRVGEMAGIKVVNRSTGGNQGNPGADVGLSFSGNGNNGGSQNTIAIGQYPYGSPLANNSYVLQVQYPEGPSGGMPIASGGIDLRQATFSSTTGFVGGGFAWASQGSMIDYVGNLQSQYALLISSATGETLDLTMEQLSGTPTVANGGTQAAVGQHMIDPASGSEFAVSAVSGSAVTTVTVMKTGWVKAASAPSSITLNCLLTSECRGVTLNTSWALANNGSPVLSLGGTGSVSLVGTTRFAAPANWSANGSIATSMTSLGPSGAHATVQEWLTVVDSSGTTRYIPAY